MQHASSQSIKIQQGTEQIQKGAGFQGYRSACVVAVLQGNTSGIGHIFVKACVSSRKRAGYLCPTSGRMDYGHGV